LRGKETLDASAPVDREFIEARLRRLMEMRAANDHRGMLEYVAEDIVFDVRGNWTVFPFAGPVKGKDMVARALMSIATQFENLGSTVKEIVIDGDRVAIRRTACIRHRGTSKTAYVDFADFIRFRDGLVIEFAEIADSVVLARLDEV
jgi:ketosteroid isomerase-like protein